MSNAVELDVKCEDFLKDNPHLYAHKAKRKKIALISVEAVNRDLTELRIELGGAKLHVGEQTYAVESPGVIIRRLSEFTWDFLVYSVLVFQPALVVVDAFLFLSGPLYNRRLRKQLHLLSDGEMILVRGDRKKAILGFCRVSKGAAQLQLAYRRDDGERREITCDILQARRQLPMLKRRAVRVVQSPRGQEERHRQHRRDWQILAHEPQFFRDRLE